MENVSKALLIAAAILIVILLITIGIRIFSSTSNSQRTAEDTGRAISEETGLAMSAITGESSSNQTEKQYGPIYEIEESNTGNREGKEVTYKGISYIILYDNGDTLQMVTKEAMGNLNLGNGDSQAIGNNNFEKVVNSYNNAINRLNRYCESLIGTDGNILSVRSVGSNPTNKNSENATPYTDNNLASWSCQWNGNPVTVNGVGKSSDTNYEQDIEKMKNLGILAGGKPYWLASRMVYAYSSSHVYFRVRFVWYDGSFSYRDLWHARYDGDTYIYISDNVNAVRPVVTIKTSALNL